MSRTDKMTGLKRHALGLGAVAVVLASATGFVSRERGSAEGARLFQEVLNLVQVRAVEPISQDSLYEHAARGLLKNIGDPYAELFSPAQLAQFNRESLRNSYGGLGVLIEEQDDGRVIVTKVYPQTPAERGGVVAGDHIVRIDGKPTDGWKVDQISSNLTGPAGTSVEVVFRRIGVDELITSRFTRQMVHVPAVPFAMMIDGGIGYIPLQQFSNSSGEEMRNAIETLRAQGATRFILDLRGNSGGSVDQSVRISNLFLRMGQEIASVRARDDEQESYVAEVQPLLPSEPMVILVDGNAASASEIVAGSLQDHDRALIVGTTTFGKGLVQDLYRLDGGYALKLTTGKWYTPSGRSIQRPRRVNAQGQLVLDTATTDTSKANRPTFRSDAGRVVYGGGGVTPDVMQKPDTSTLAERAFMQAVAPKAQATARVLDQYSLELRGQVKPDFTVTQAWRDEVFRRLRAAEVNVTRAQFDAVAPLIDRLLEDRVATAAFGDSASFRRQYDEDAQVQRAIEMLRNARSQQEVFARADAANAANVRTAAQPAARPRTRR